MSEENFTEISEGKKMEQKKLKTRETWGNSMDFFLSTLGLAVGLSK